MIEEQFHRGTIIKRDEVTRRTNGRHGRRTMKDSQSQRQQPFLLIPVDVRQLHPGEIRVVYRGGLPGRVPANFGGATAGCRRPLVRNVPGPGDLLQRDTDGLHIAEAAQAQPGSDGIQFRLPDGVQDDQEGGRCGAVRESVLR